MAEGKSRAGDLDLWRGLCLVNVVLVHLAYNGIGFPEPIDAAIKHYTRFAAGGFVFLAGLSIAVIFGRRIDGTAAERSQVYQWCLRRGLMLLVVDTCAAAVFRILDLVRAFPADADSPLAVALAELFALQRPGITGGILQFYAIMFAVWPAVFELRRRAGRIAVLAVSLLLYAAAVAFAGGFLWPPFEFPVAYWQVLFTLGFVSDQIYRRRTHSGPWIHATWLAAAVLAYGVVFLDLHGPEFGIDVLRAWSPFDYSKTPLQPGAALWYVATFNVVLAMSSLILSLGVGTRTTRLLQLLGRHSLTVYVAHVFTEAVVMEYVWSVWPMAAWRVSASLLDLTALLTLCWVAEARWFVTLPARLMAWLKGLGMAPQPVLARSFTSLAAVAWVSVFVIMRQPAPNTEIANHLVAPVSEMETEAAVVEGSDLAGSFVEAAVGESFGSEGGMTPLDADHNEDSAALDAGTPPGDGGIVEDPTALTDEAQLVGPI